MKFPKKIPTLVGLLSVVILVGVVVVFSETLLRVPLRASGSQQPTEVQVTNVSDVSFTVTWLTGSPATGSVLVSSPGKANRLYYDQRDASGKLGTYTAHSVTVLNVTPNTQFTMKVLSNGKPFEDKQGPYAIRTPATLPANTNALEPAYGTVYANDNTPVEGALVYLTLEGGRRLSTLTKSSGLWLIPLSRVRTEDLSGYLAVSDRITESIIVRHRDSQIRATTDPLNDSPVPDMVLGQTYDFRGLQVNTVSNKALALQSTPPQPQAPEQTIGGSVISASTAKKQSVALVSPADGAALPTTLPLISGTGIPSAFVGVTVGINTPQSGSTKVNTDGTWNFTPSKHLVPGKQSVTITTVDDKGKTVAITHAFQILKSGTQVLGDATPSATLTVTLAPTASATATPTESITEAPTTESTLSGEPIPETGSTLPTIILLLIGLGLLASGVVAIKL